MRAKFNTQRLAIVARQVESLTPGSGLRIVVGLPVVIAVNGLVEGLSVHAQLKAVVVCQSGKRNGQPAQAPSISGLARRLLSNPCRELRFAKSEKRTQYALRGKRICRGSHDVVTFSSKQFALLPEGAYRCGTAAHLFERLSGRIPN